MNAWIYECEDEGEGLMNGFCWNDDEHKSSDLSDI